MIKEGNLKSAGDLHSLLKAMFKDALQARCGAWI